MSGLLWAVNKMADPALIARAMEHMQPALKGAGFAVSGGSDSLGMLLLLAPVLQAQGVPVAVVTVDHQLRSEAAEEAEFVAAICARHGWPHEILRWSHGGQGNLAKAAREGRYRLMADWAKARGLPAVLLGHTQDDQAETFLMRLSRGAGVDGLSAMAPARHDRGVTWLRPLLGARRADLRAVLEGMGQNWRDDPSNDDRSYERVRIRQAMAGLADLGLTPELIAQSASRLRLARGALSDLARKADGISSLHGSVQITRAGFAALADETQERLLSQAIRWVAGQDYPPRFAPLVQALAVARGRGRFGCHGALVISGRDSVTITRESRAVALCRTPTDQLWDGRWRLHGPHDAALHLAPLGEHGLTLLATDAGFTADLSALPRAAYAVTPAVWRGRALVAAPAVGFGGDWQAETPNDFVSFREYD